MTRFSRSLAAAAGVLCLSVPLALCAGAAALAQGGPADIAGSWRMSCTGPRGGERIVTLSLQQSGASVTGSFSADRRSGKVSGEVKGDQVTLSTGRGGFTGTASGGMLTGKTRRGLSCTATRS